MSVIAEFSIPASDFVLGRALQASEGLAIEMEKVIPTGDDAIPYFWVIGENAHEFDEVLQDEPGLLGFEVVDELDGRKLYRTRWDPSVDTFLEATTGHDAALLEAGGDASSWGFQFRFPDSHELSEFHTACREADIDISIDRLYNPVEPRMGTEWGLTEAQRNLLEYAYDKGYFDVPRRITQVEIAEGLGVSDQSVNERLRRGLSALIESSIKSSRSQAD